VLQSGVLPADADSIGIPMFGSVIVALVVSPVVLGIAWLSLRRYNSDARLAALRWDRPYRTTLITLFFGALAAFLLFRAITDAIRAQPWYEYLWSGYATLWMVWTLALRAALVEQRSPTDDEKAEAALSYVFYP